VQHEHLRVAGDALGLFASAPPFAKRFAELATVATDGLRAYAAEVRDGTFPAPRKIEGDAPVYVVAAPPRG
jgi:ketopantoate hydroxymethyltransferase